jgi:hypothetical protein
MAATVVAADGLRGGRLVELLQLGAAGQQRERSGPGCGQGGRGGPASGREGGRRSAPERRRLLVSYGEVRGLASGTAREGGVQLLDHLDSRLLGSCGQDHDRMSPFHCVGSFWPVARKPGHDEAEVPGAGELGHFGIGLPRHWTCSASLLYANVRR